MGCSLSLKSPDQASPNIFKVFNVDDSGQDRNPGKLEVTEQALILHQKGKEPVGWPLRGLRRYGFDADLFSFESGRRCPTGPGIYAFRCQQAETLFNLLQNYITLAGHVDQQRRMLGQRDRHDQTPVRPDTTHGNFVPVHGLAATPQNGHHIPLSEYRNISNPLNPGFGQPNSPRITLARLPDILAMSQQRTVDPVIHYADLDLSGRPGDEDQDVFPDEEEDEAAASASARHSSSTSASNQRSYVNVPARNAAAGLMTNGYNGLLSESVPTHTYANLDLISSTASTPVSRVNYIQLDLEMFNDGPDGATCQSPTSSPISPASFHPESPHSQRDSYTTIDFDRTRALNAISIDNGTADEGLRKTRHNSNIEMLTLN